MRADHSLQWRHNGHGSVSNHQPHDCLLNRLFRRRSKKTLKLRVTGLCAGNSPRTGEFPAQMASYAENASIWWRHHDSVEQRPDCNHEDNTISGPSYLYDSFYFETGSCTKYFTSLLFTIFPLADGGIYFPHRFRLLIFIAVGTALVVSDRSNLTIALVSMNNFTAVDDVNISSRCIDGNYHNSTTALKVHMRYCVQIHNYTPHRSLLDIIAYPFKVADIRICFWSHISRLLNKA